MVVFLRASALLGALILGGAGAASASEALGPEQLFEQLAPSVWTVETFDAQNKPVSTGSAVVIGAGSLVTNCHVLAKARRVAITRENVGYGATIDAADPERDLCLLKVRNFTAPAVVPAEGDDLKVGARVYAIGSPRGLEQTISDGLLSGLRRSADGDLAALQVTVPISPGSSGGGLFDGKGRLIGITTFQLRDSQNLNFAVPARWIAEVPQRSKARLEDRARPPSVADGRARVYEYALKDRLTGNTRTVSYRLERADGEKLFFNQGSRIERPGGGVVSMTSAIGGEFDVAMPPGGWVDREPDSGATWKIQYSQGVQGQRVRLSATARVLGEGTMRLKDRELRVIKVGYEGFTERGGGAINNPAGRYLAQAWYSPDLGRVVRFEARTRGGNGAAAFIIDELLELVDVRTD